MARQEIILGTAPTGLGGDPPRTASTKINAMTSELYGVTNALGTASRENITTISDPVWGLPRNVTKSGDYGIGALLSARVLPTGGSNRADVLQRNSGFSIDLINGGDKPTGVVDGPMITMGFDNTQGFQLQFDWRDGTIHTFPSATAAPTKAWVKQYHVNNVTGTMAGGAIMERGSTATGQFIKYSSGLLVCWTISIAPSLLNSSNIGVSWQFPAAFVSSPTVIAGLRSGDAPVQKPLSGPYGIGSTATSVNLYMLSPTGSFVTGDTTSIAFQATATGWWK